MAQVELEILGELPQELPQKTLESWIKTYSYPYQAVALEVRFIKPEEMQLLNRLYRQKDESTDILEFPTATAAKNEPIVHLGSIVISAPDHYRKLGLSRSGITRLASKRVKADHDSSPAEWKALIRHGIGNLVKYHEHVARPL